MTKIYVGESYHYEFNIGIDGTDYTVTISYKDPSGEITSDVATTTDDATTGIYYVDFASDFFTEGIWNIWYDLEDADGVIDVSEANLLSVEQVPSGIVTVDFVKSHLNIGNTDYDVQITNYIPMIESDYLGIRNAPFDTDAAGNIVYPLGAQVVAADMIATKLRAPITFDPDDAKALSSESIGSYSVSYDNTANKGANGVAGYPVSIISSITRYINGA